MAHIKFVKVVNYLAIAVTSQSKDRKHLQSLRIPDIFTWSAHPIVSAVNLGSNGEKKFTDVDSLVAHGAFILCFGWLVIAIAR